MKCVCISDTHNRQWESKLVIPDGDVLIHAGDMTIMGTPGELVSVANWFEKIRDRFSAIVFTPGNHDLLFEDDLPRAMKFFEKMNNVHCLINQQIVINGMKFWGTPFTKRFRDWGFNVDPDKLSPYWEMIPSDTDVLITHQPPYGTGDYISYESAPGIPRRKNKEHLGCSELKRKVEQLQPRLHVYGHIHSGAGTYRHGRTVMVNASVLNEQYSLVNEPTVVEI